MSKDRRFTVLADPCQETDFTAEVTLWHSDVLETLWKPGQCWYPFQEFLYEI